jgi:hypothetical protein
MYPKRRGKRRFSQLPIEQWHPACRRPDTNEVLHPTNNNNLLLS